MLLLKSSRKMVLPGEGSRSMVISGEGYMSHGQSVLDFIYNINIHTDACTCTHLHASCGTHARTQARTHTHACTHMHVCTYTHTQTYCIAGILRGKLFKLHVAQWNCQILCQVSCSL